MTHWKDRAACKGMPEVMFPLDGVNATSAEADARLVRAVSICEDCDVVAECTELRELVNAEAKAAIGDSMVGVWAGQAPAVTRDFRRLHAEREAKAEAKRAREMERLGAELEKDAEIIRLYQLGVGYKEIQRRLGVGGSRISKLVKSVR